MPTRALIVIDVQNDYIAGNLPIEHPPTAVSLPNIGRAIDAAGAQGIPVVVVQNVAPEGSPFMAQGTVGAELHEVVASRPRDHFILKGLPSCFAATDLESWLRQRHIDTLTVVGYMTHNCDLSTIVDAVHRGFSCELLSDATGSLPYANSAGFASGEEIHRVMTVVLQARFATVMTTEQWLAAAGGGEAPARDTIFASNRRGRDFGEEHPLRNVKRGIGVAEARELLERGEYGILSTCGPGGIPYGVPLSYCVQGDSVYFHCAVAGRKLENLCRNDRVSFCVVGATEVLAEKFSTRYESVILSGRCVEVHDGEKQQALEGLVAKYSAPHRERGREYIASAWAETKVFRIAIAELCGKARR